MFNSAAGGPGMTAVAAAAAATAPTVSTVSTEDQSCPCGEPSQTRDHILASCPTYRHQRYILKDASEDLIISDILGTKSGVEALISFFSSPNAFKKQSPHPTRSTPT